MPNPKLIDKNQASKTVSNKFFEDEILRKIKKSISIGNIQVGSDNQHCVSVTLEKAPARIKINSANDIIPRSSQQLKDIAASLTAKNILKLELCKMSQDEFGTKKIETTNNFLIAEIRCNIYLKERYRNKMQEAMERQEEYKKVTSPETKYDVATTLQFFNKLSHASRGYFVNLFFVGDEECGVKHMREHPAIGEVFCKYDHKNFISVLTKLSEDLCNRCEEENARRKHQSI